MTVYEWGFTEEYSVYEPESEEFEDLLDEGLGEVDDWEPIRLIEVSSTKGRPQKNRPGDFPGTTSFNHLVSQAAVDALGEMLIGFGDLFPVEIEGQSQAFYIFKCTNSVDCLDEKASTIVRSDLGFMKSVIITLPVFHEDRVGDNHVFIVPQVPESQARIYVTSAFKDAAQKAGLKGLCLHKGNLNQEKAWVS